MIWLWAVPASGFIDVLARLGKLSYSLYLWHWVLLSFGRIYTGRPLGHAATCAALLLSFGIASFSYRYIESIRYRSWRGTTPVLLLAMVACAMTGFAVVRHNGLPQRAHLAYLAEYGLQLKRTPHEDAQCRAYVRKWLQDDGLFYYCRASNDVGVDNQPKIAVIGDSHAHVLFPGIQAEARKRGVATVVLANSSCPPLPGFLWGNTAQRREKCQESIEQIYRIIELDGSISTVLLTTRGPVYLHGEPETPFTEKSVQRGLKIFEDPEHMNWASFADGLSAAVDRLSAVDHVKRVLYLLENPELDFRPKDIPPRPFDRWGLSLRKSWVPRALYEQRMRTYREVVTEVQRTHPQLRVLDPAPFLCDDLRCYAFKDGQFLYADDDHYSIFGSRYLARLLAKELFSTSGKTQQADLSGDK